MADDEAVFVTVWTEKWSKIGIPRQLTTAGSVRRLHIASLLGKSMPGSAEIGHKLIDGIFTDLKSVLKEGSTFWSPAPGLIDIFYPKQLPQAADLSHSVVRSTIERRIRDTVVEPARAVAASTQQSPGRRVTLEDFKRLAGRAKARPDQIQTIDVSELILGKADPKAHLSKRAWRIIDGIVDEFLDAGGYCSMPTDNQLLLFFPGLSASLSRIKRNAIAQEIEHSAGIIARSGETADSEDKPLPKAITEAAAKKRLGEDAKEIAELNKAFSALAATSNGNGDAALPSGHSFRAIPVWRAGNQTLVGHSIFAAGTTDSEGIPEDLLDLACLVKAQNDIRDAIAANSPYLVLGRLHWHSLDRPAARSRYLELASKLPEAARRYLVLALYDVPEDLLSARIEERIRELRRYCRSVSCKVDLARRGFDQLKGQDLHAIGAELSPDGIKLTESEIMISMNGFLDALAPLQTKSFIDGLQTKSLVIAALAAGFDYLSGSAILDAQEGAQGVRAFSIPDLYAGDENQ